MPNYDEELSLEQKYFDAAYDARERGRELLRQAPSAAAGPRAAVRGVQRAADARLAAFAAESDEVAFGRFDPEDDEESPLYVGRQAILDEERDILVINWQAPAASPFYEASVEKPLGVSRVRKFETECNEILSFEDLLLADLAERIDELTADEKRGVDDALLRDLEADRTGEMKDIVQTIHASQYDLIRQSMDQLLVIQGGPGTGKTAVALHRASWLLFNHRGDVDAADFLVIGPSKTFGRYIQKVLPGLGNDGVAQTDLTSLGPLTSSGRIEPDLVARLKGDARMAPLIRRALGQRIRFPERAQVLEVGRVSLPRGDVEAQLAALRASPTYNTGRTALRDWIGTTANRMARGTVQIDAASIDQATERVWPSLTPAAFLQDLLGSRQRIMAAGGDDLTAADIERMYRSAAAGLRQETWSHADVALLDEVDFLMNGRGRSYAHVIIDEAQDLSPMQLRSVRRRSSRGAYTIVGDLAQSTGPWARNSWDDVISALKQDLDARFEELQLGYRVPRQVTDLADRLLPLIAPELEPATVVRRGPTDPEVLRTETEEVVDLAVESASLYAGQGHFTGIICARSQHDVVAACLRSRGINFTDANDGGLNNSINLLTAEQSKGLEFDAVVVIEPAEIADVDASGLRHLYIALTRTTRSLTIAHSRRFEPLGLEHGEDQGVDLSLIESITEPPPRSRGNRRGGVLAGRSDVPPPPPTPATLPAPPRRGGSVRERVVRVTAEALADEVRDTLGPEAYPDLLRALAEQLGVNLDREA